MFIAVIKLGTINNERIKKIIRINKMGLMKKNFLI